jgi:hypothetical protein
MTKTAARGLAQFFNFFVFVVDTAIRRERIVAGFTLYLICGR